MQSHLVSVGETSSDVEVANASNQASFVTAGQIVKITLMKAQMLTVVRIP